DTLPVAAGMNRFVWNLRYDDPVNIPDAFYSGLAPRGPIVAPGHYTLRLTVDGQALTAPLTVARDPRMHGPDDALMAKFALSMKVYHDQDALHRAVLDIRGARETLKNAASADAQALAARASSIEGRLMQVQIHSSEGSLLFPVLLNEQIYALAWMLEDADTAPTREMVQAFDAAHAQLTALLAEWDEVKGRIASAVPAK
ncbi:MAG TPA: hypothetical protein VHE37_11185, partial [Nevskiaceae bacterium]|nr:hypothetical protein [Nevskiaceae bacterium]